ncbi:MAG: hypothetical protein IJ197_04965 [Bacteroidaceae bacterium]|nr:hypothetical protein [Bacteroidaceae bacterium]
MKKFLLSLIALLGAVSVNAQTTADVSGYDNAIYAVGNRYVKGVEIQLPIKIKNAINAQACSFYVTLQDGLNFVPNSKDATAIAATIASADADHTIMSNIDNGMVVLFSATNSELPEDMLYLNLIAAEAGEYTITISNLNISNADNGQEIRSTDSFVSTIVIDDYLTLDENSTTVPGAYESVNVLVKRTMNAGEWSTLCLPFDMTAEQVSEVFGDGSEFATFDSYKKDGGNASTSQKFTATKIEINFEPYDWTEDGIFANVPYLVKSKNALSEFELSNIDVNADEDEANIGYKKSGKVVGTAYGTLHAGEYVPEYGLFLSGGNFYYSKGKTKIKGFRGYFVLNDVLADLTSAGVKMDFNVVTKIDGVNLTDSEGAVYTVDGKFIGRDVDQKKLQKGIYIIDGKKVAIK